MANTHRRISDPEGKEWLAQREHSKSSKKMHAPSHHHELTVSFSYTQSPVLRQRKGRMDTEGLSIDLKQYI